MIVAFGFTAGTESTFDVRNFFFGQKQLRGSMASDPKDLVWGLEQVKAGKIQPLLDRTLPLKEAAQAHRLHRPKRRERQSRPSAVGRVTSIPG